MDQSLPMHVVLIKQENEWKKKKNKQTSDAMHGILLLPTMPIEVIVYSLGPPAASSLKPSPTPMACTLILFYFEVMQL